MPLRVRRLSHTLGAEIAVVMWDNRCTMHLALGDCDETQLRHMERTTVLGTPSGYVYDGPLH